jgi:hypothetical protein
MAHLSNQADQTAEQDVKGTTARVQVIAEVVEGSETSWRLCFQWCRYIYDDGTMQEGYRFIWRRPDGSLQAARGQARIPSVKVARELMRHAEAAGWGTNEGAAPFPV